MTLIVRKIGYVITLLIRCLLLGEAYGLRVALRKEIHQLKGKEAVAA